ncbi:MAG: MFS transporter [Rhodanobacteraceae bacterium]
MSVQTLHDWFHDDIEAPLARLVGGRERLKVITLLACVLGLDAADKATVGAVAAALEHALHIGNIEIGWLVSASTAVGAVVTLPFGVLADQVDRTRLLTIGIVVWSVAMLVNGASNSYSMLLVSRLFLGAVVGVAGPTVVSLVGDFFRPGERGRIFGYILAGELLGVAFGFLISGNIAAILSWRASFWMLGGIGFILAWVIRQSLSEPARGGQGRLPSDSKVDKADTKADSGPDHPSGSGKNPARPTQIESKIESRAIEPHESLVLKQDPATLSVWGAARHVLAVRTYRSLLIASALGYFYFTGLRTFAIVFMRNRFDLGQAAASSIAVGLGLGAIAGVLLTGRIGDALIQRGRLNGRVLMGAAAYLIASAVLVPALLVSSLAVAAPFLFVAAAGIGGANPAVDSAMLDVMPSGLWGRAEGVRSTLRYALEAMAPPLFGLVASWFGGRGVTFGLAAGHDSTGGTGLGQAFLVLLVPLAIAGAWLLFPAARTYPRDVATAIASERAAKTAR